MYRCWNARWIWLCAMLLAFCIGMTSVAALSAPEGRDPSAIRLPILMYHSILKTASRTGKYVVTPAELESDLRYLKEEGYTTVFVSDVVAYVKQGTPLPPKPIILTFDDGFLNNKTYLLPLLESFDMKATVSVVGSYCERYSAVNDPNPNYAHLTWSDSKELAASGRIELGNHTYNMHRREGRRGCSRKSGEDVATYQQILREDLSKTQTLLQEQVGVTPKVFAYPYGYISREALPVLQELGFESALTCYEKVNWITRDADCLYHLHRFNRAGGMSTKRFMKRIA